MNVVVMNVKVTDLKSKEADELEEETDVLDWKVEENGLGRLYTPSLKTNYSFHAVLWASSLNIRNKVPMDRSLKNNACRYSQPGRMPTFGKPDEAWGLIRCLAWSLHQSEGCFALTKIAG